MAKNKEMKVCIYYMIIARLLVDFCIDDASMYQV